MRGDDTPAEAQITRDFNALEFRFRGGYTRRYHGLRMLGEDTVGHHSYNVAQIVRFIAADLPPMRRAYLVEAALDHDVAETVVGDMPAPAKRRLPDYPPGEDAAMTPGASFREVFARMEGEVMEEHGMDDVSEVLTPGEAVLLKAADSMDGMRLCIQERAMGNTLVVTTYEAFRSYVAALPLDSGGRAARLCSTFEMQWGTANGGR